MSIRTVYVCARSKRKINEVLKMDQRAFEAIEYSLSGADVFDLETLPVGTVVNVFNRYVGGVPYAKAYGTIARNKAGRMFIK